MTEILRRLELSPTEAVCFAILIGMIALFVGLFLVRLFVFIRDRRREAAAWGQMDECTRAELAAAVREDYTVTPSPNAQARRAQVRAEGDQDAGETRYH